MSKRGLRIVLLVVAVVVALGLATAIWVGSGLVRHAIGRRHFQAGCTAMNRKSFDEAIAEFTSALRFP
ncbi:MAG: hypothetical protein ACR2NX_02800, partial [Chthoniobacterales bacterium]